MFNKRKLDTELEDQLKRSKNGENSVDGAELELLNLIRNEQVDDQLESETYNVSWVSSQVNRIHKAIITNSELRSKYRDDPLKFLDSEFELLEAVKSLSGLSLCEDNEVLKYFCDNTTTLELFLMIKTHPNTDIGSQLITIINELLDNEDEELFESLIPIFEPLFVKTKFTYLLCDHLVKLHQTLGDPLVKESVKFDTAENVEISLILLTKLTEFSQLNKYLIDDKKLIRHVLARIDIDKPAAVDHILQVYAEFLFALVSETVKFKIPRLERLLEKYNLVELLLVNFSKFMRLKNLTDEQEEYLDNLIDSLCYLLQGCIEAKKQFLKNEGLDLLFVVFSKESKNSWAVSACFKIMTNALSASDEVSLEIASLVITKGGLKYLFKYLKKDKKYVIGVLESLFRLLELNSLERIRLFNKLLDNDAHHLKVILEMALDYQEQINNEPDELVQLDLGLEQLQTLHIIIAWCLVDPDFSPLLQKLDTEKWHDTVKESLEIQIDTLQLANTSPSSSAALENSSPQTWQEITAQNSEDSLELLGVLVAQL